MHTRRGGCAAVSMGGQIYVMGGYDASNFLSSVEVYSLTSGQWTSLPPMHNEHYGCAAVSMGGYIYVMG
eukprot:5056548-Ditylum_brightwellii.AAC.1